MLKELPSLYAERIQAWRRATTKVSHSTIDPKRNAVALYDALANVQTQNAALLEALENCLSLLQTMVRDRPNDKWLNETGWMSSRGLCEHVTRTIRNVKEK